MPAVMHLVSIFDTIQESFSRVLTLFLEHAEVLCRTYCMDI